MGKNIGVSIMRDFIDEIMESKDLNKKSKVFTIENFKEIANMDPLKRKELVYSYCDEKELTEFMNEEYKPDAAIILQFAIEDLSIGVEELSKKTKIKHDELKNLINGKKMPWKLKVEEIVNIINILDISTSDFIDAVKRKNIAINPKDLNISGIHLPRAKNLNKKEQKKAMLELERQIAIQDEIEERDHFIEELKCFVNR
jgi:hypothetical protein